jgi:hypothetical protein
MASSWIWQQLIWPQFRWTGSALEPLLEQARAARQEPLSRRVTLEAPLDREAISTLLSRESLGRAAIEGALLDPGQVRSSVARRLSLPLAEGQPFMAPGHVVRGWADQVELQGLNQLLADLGGGGHGGIVLRPAGARPDHHFHGIYSSAIIMGKM